MSLADRPLPRAASWTLAALGALIVALGVVNSVREPGLDAVSLCMGGSIVLNAASVAQPPGRTRVVLVVAALALAAGGLAAVFL